MLDQSTACLGALSTHERHIDIVHNPTSGARNGRRLRRFVEALGRHGLTAVVRATRCAGDAEAMAAALDGSATDVFCVAGGDGTINEVINGLGRAAPPIALLPMGTANVLAAEIGLPGDAGRLAEAIDRGATTLVHLPRANGRRFAMMTGVGFDAHVVAAVDARLKRLAGKAAYVAAFVRTLRQFPYRRYTVVVDGVGYDAASLVIANGHYYGGRFTCAPDARLDQPELHVCLFRRSGRRSAVGYGLSLLLGRLHRRADVTIVRGRHVTVHGEAGEPVQCDGDLSTRLPLTVCATGETLRFIADPPTTRR